MVRLPDVIPLSVLDRIWGLVSFFDYPLIAGILTVVLLPSIQHMQSRTTLVLVLATVWLLSGFVWMLFVDMLTWLATGRHLIRIAAGAEDA